MPLVHMIQEQNKKPFDTSQCFCQVPVSKQLLQQRTILQAFCQIHSQTGFELPNYQKGFNWSQTFDQILPSAIVIFFYIPIFGVSII